MTTKTATAASKPISIDDLDEVSVTPVRPSRAKKQRAANILFFDLETMPDYERMELFGLEPIPEPAKRGEFNKLPPVGDMLKQTLEKIKDDLKSHNPCDEYLDALDACEKAAPKPRKGVLDLTAELRRQDATRDAAIAAQRKTMSVTPEFCRIVALGWSLGSEAKSLVLGQQPHVTEQHILQAFWELAKMAKTVCGFNILGFDLPVIFVRSILLDVAPTRQFDLKPWGTDVCDLMAKRFPKSGSMGLKRIAAAMGMEIDAGDVDGSQVEELFKSDPEMVGKYVRSDVRLCVDMHERYSGFFC